MWKVVRTASALDAASRTLPMEVQVSNPDQTLDYVRLRFAATKPISAT